MRLIDADKFKECFNTDTAIGKTMRLMIGEQPTAYDVDKVVEKLEDFRKDAEDNRAFLLKCAYENAIEIVKSGGIE